MSKDITDLAAHATNKSEYHMVAGSAQIIMVGGDTIAARDYAIGLLETLHTKAALLGEPAKEAFLGGTIGYLAAGPLGAAAGSLGGAVSGMFKSGKGKDR